MSGIFIHGLGAVSPAGWGVAALRDAVWKQAPLPVAPLIRPGWEKSLHARPVPPPVQRPAFLAHPRLRRSSLITQHTVAAALEALGDDAAKFQHGEQRLGIIVCLMSGCVNYSRRFYEEVLQNPATASPLLFPETVFNAPGSHLAAFLNSTAISYTLVGDDSAFPQGLAVGAGWLLNDEVDGCLVLGAEEMDWLIADALELFSPQTVQAGGASAVYLRREKNSSSIELAAITEAFPFSSRVCRTQAAQTMRAELPPDAGRELLVLGTQGLPASDADELAAWCDWKGSRLAPKQVLGEAFTASAGWQCVAACDALARGEFDAANVSVVGVNQQAIGVRFLKPS